MGLYIQGCKPDEEPEPQCNGTLAVAVNTIVDTPCGEEKGSITVSASGGEGSYQFQLDGGSFQNEAIFNEVAQGDHTITVKDANDCVTDVQATVMTGVVFSDIVSIIKTNCAISGCHDGSNSRPNFKEDATIKSRASSIKDRTSNKVMPPSSSGITLTDEEIALLACWADDGAPD